MSDRDLKIDMRELFNLVKTIEDLPKVDDKENSKHHIVIGTINIYPQYIIDSKKDKKEIDK